MKNKILKYKIKFCKWLGKKLDEIEYRKQIKLHISELSCKIFSNMLDGKTECNYKFNPYSYDKFFINDDIIAKTKDYFIRKGYKIEFEKDEYGYNGRYYISWEEKHNERK